MTLYKTFRYWFITSLLIVYCTSCKKFIQIPNPVDQIVSAAVFSNDETAISAMDGFYSQVMSSNYFILNGGVSILAGLSADEIYNRLSFVTADNEFYTNSISSSNANLRTRLWNAAYQEIYQLNAILEGLNASTSLTKSVKEQLTGEAEFMRALYYFYLVNLFGKVPLVLTTNYKINATLPRSEESKIYQQVITDLTDAQKLLSDSYPSDNRSRPNKLAATALLARVYLYDKDWSAAVTQASSVISSGLYQLETDLNKVFLINSNEVIIQLQVVNSSFNCTVEGYSFIPGLSASSAPTYPLTTFQINAFEKGDLRAKDWINSKEVSGILYYYAYKYKTGRSRNAPVEYNVVLRLAEQYLIRAEANAQMGNMQDAEADLNIIRRRAGLPDTTADNQNELLKIILHERQVELFTEWGNRWLDLKRTGNADAILGTEKVPYWKSTDTLYPIPLSQLKLNPFLTQNDGY